MAKSVFASESMRVPSPYRLVIRFRNGKRVTVGCRTWNEALTKGKALSAFREITSLVAERDVGDDVERVRLV